MLATLLCLAGLTVVSSAGAGSYGVHGNTIYDPDGSLFIRHGNTWYGSDGSLCTRYGNQIYCQSLLPTDLHRVLTQPPESSGNNEPVGIGDMNRAGLFPVIPAQAGIQCFRRLAGFRSQPVPAKAGAGVMNLKWVGQQ